MKTTRRWRFVITRMITSVLTVVSILLWAPSAEAITGPDSHVFDDTRVGEIDTAPLTFVAERSVTESGEAVGAASLEGPDVSDFAISADNCSNSVVAVSCRITLDFRPLSAGMKEVILRLPGGGGAVDVSLRGNGFVVGRRIATEPGMLDFGDVHFNYFSKQKSVKLINTGDLAVRPIVRLGGRNPDTFFVTNPGCVSAVLIPGGECNLDLIMLPGSVGPRTSALSIECNPECVPVIVMVKGQGVQEADPGGSGAAPEFISDVRWSLGVLSARMTSGKVRVMIFSSLPARFEVRLRQSGRTVVRKRVKGGPGRVAVRIDARRLRRGRRSSVEVVARRGDISRRAKASIRR
jgi:hypothetical protein